MLVSLRRRLEPVEERSLADPSWCQQQHVVSLQPQPELGLLVISVEEVLALDRTPDAVSNSHISLVGPRSSGLLGNHRDSADGVRAHFVQHLRFTMHLL
jgi:hypothetical protein